MMKKCYHCLQFSIWGFSYLPFNPSELVSKDLSNYSWFQPLMYHSLTGSIFLLFKGMHKYSKAINNSFHKCWLIVEKRMEIFVHFFFFFFFSKILVSFLGLFPFCFFFLLQKDFSIFHIFFHIFSLCFWYLFVIFINFFKRFEN